MVKTSTYSEHELVSLLKNRDSKSFGYLYDHYCAALHAIILQIVEDQELANDVLQEVFINIYKKIDTYDPTKGKLFTWMLNIARNASIDVLRSRSYQNSQKNRTISENVNDYRNSAVVLNIDTIGLKKVLQSLREEYRTLIELSYFKGYTHEEIAEIEDIPLGTVKTRIRSALIQLRELLK